MSHPVTENLNLLPCVSDEYFLKLHPPIYKAKFFLGDVQYSKRMNLFLVL